MKIAALFNELDAPSAEGNALCAIRIPSTSFSRIAKDSEGQPALLFALSSSFQKLSIRSYRLKYLELLHNVSCNIKEHESIDSGIFTLLRFKSKIPQLQEYFLSYVESLVQIIESNPTEQQLMESIAMVVEIFSLLTDAPVKSIQGLWAELAVIDMSKDPAALVDFWHALPEEKYDFNSGAEKLEVKGSASLERAHYFASDQLIVPFGSSILVASLFVRPSSNGWSLQRLVDSVTDRLGDDFSLITKLNRIVVQTLGASLEEHLGSRFDYETGKESLLYYTAEAIPRINAAHIPPEVSDVKFRSDLKYVRPADVASLQGKGRLFSAI